MDWRSETSNTQFTMCSPLRCLLTVLLSATVVIRAEREFYTDLQEPRVLQFEKVLRPGSSDFASQQDEDEIQQGLMMRQLANFLHAQQQERETRTVQPDAGFSYHFPKQAVSPFALRPSDPNYYQKQDVIEDGGDLMGQLHPRQSKSDEDEPTIVPFPPRNSMDLTTKFPINSGSVVHSQVMPQPAEDSDLYFIAIVAGCSAAAIVGIIAIGISWYRLQKNAKAAADVEYPAYGVTGPNKETSPTGDRRLAQSAQMYHYQHQKQQIIAMESQTGTNERPGSVSEAESEEEGEEGDYTVYECPGLAPTGEMEVKNPLFHDDPTPATPKPAAKKDEPDNQQKP